MHDYLLDYKDYYHLRMTRYEGNPDYPFSFESEKAIYDAMISCKELGEFREKLGNLNELNAVAQTRDQYAMRLRHYQKLKEFVRAKGPERILEKAPSQTNVTDLMTMVMNEESRNMLEITLDDIGFYKTAFDSCDRLERYENANVPSGYRSEYKHYAEEERGRIRESLTDFENNFDAYQPGYRFNFDLFWEERHRRLFPFSDEVLLDRIEKVRTICNR